MKTSCHRERSVAIHAVRSHGLLHFVRNDEKNNAMTKNGAMTNMEIVMPGSTRHPGVRSGEDKKMAATAIQRHPGEQR